MTAASADLRDRQLRQLRHLVGELLGRNPFWTARLEAAGLGGDPERALPDLAALRRLPPITKDEVVEDQRRHPPWGSNRTYSQDRYTRFHQTSGTTGTPLRWLDTDQSWSWMLDAWEEVFRTAGVGRDDRVFFPFSFGPFLGFWTAFDAAARLGCLVIPGGGLPSAARLRVMLDAEATVVCCTPTYGLRLAEVAADEGLELGGAEGPRVRALIVAGEPGGSVPATRERLSRAWGGTRVFDHHGMTEVGPVSCPNEAHPDVLHVLEESYLAEVLDPESLDSGEPQDDGGYGRPVVPGEVGELVLTTLGRLGSPLLRYRTGDRVRPSARSAEELGRPELALEGGILARGDDMVVVRGVNLYPSAVEQVLRSQPGVAEFRVELTERQAMAEARVLVEPSPEVSDAETLARDLEGALRLAFQLRLPVQPVPPGTLPRFEMKAQRWVRR